MQRDPFSKTALPNFRSQAKDPDSHVFLPPQAEPEPKRRERVGEFCAIVNEAIGNATGPGATWTERAQVAEALERFAEMIRMSIAVGRPL